MQRSHKLHRTVLAVIALGVLCVGCSTSTEKKSDASIARDFGLAEGSIKDAPTTDQRVAAFPLPIYRLGPRIVSGGWFTKEFTGTLTLPKSQKQAPRKIEIQG